MGGNGNYVTPSDGFSVGHAICGNADATDNKKDDRDFLGMHGFVGSPKTRKSDLLAKDKLILIHYIKVDDAHSSKDDLKYQSYKQYTDNMFRDDDSVINLYYASDKDEVYAVSQNSFKDSDEFIDFVKSIK